MTARVLPNGFVEVTVASPPPPQVVEHAFIVRDGPPSYFVADGELAATRLSDEAITYVVRPGDTNHFAVHVLGSCPDADVLARVPVELFVSLAGPSPAVSITERRR